MKRKIVFDSFAILAYLKKENGFEKVRDLMSSSDIILMNEINLGESFYIIAKQRGTQQAEYFINTILASLPIRHSVNTFEDVLSAARIKAKYALSFADCFAVATAQKERAPVVTGDPEFKKVQGIVEIDWI